MHYRRIPLILLLFVPFASAQHRTGDIQVRVTFSNGHNCDQQLRLDLMGGASNASSASTFTNSACMAGFQGLEVGEYHIVVSGESIQTTDSGLFQVDERKSAQFVFISVKTAGEDEASQPAGGPTVSAAAMKIPPDAQKEFDRANKLIDDQNWPKAKDKLLHALSLYPNYPAAYNNLGIVFGHMGDTNAERENLQKAVSLDSHFAEGYVNLGKFSVRQHDFPAAELYLNNAVAAGATNPPVMTLLANVQLMNKHFDDAISTCHGLHFTPESPHALCHYISARAMEHENRLENARAELGLFLTEESSGPRADQVRKELVAVQNQLGTH